VLDVYLICSGREGETCSAASGVQTEEGHAPDTPCSLSTQKDKKLWLTSFREMHTRVHCQHFLNALTTISVIIDPDDSLLLQKYSSLYIAH
jgi:hypothetical protein